MDTQHDVENNSGAVRGPCLLCSDDTTALGIFAPSLSHAFFKRFKQKRRTFVFFLCGTCHELPGQFEIAGMKFMAMPLGDICGL